ncbi:MAG: PDZ domain-containing protein [Oscillospiraceae bacterium]|nr:PDZ domain-containing protein [Oscillospiraceae bacterium]
MNKKISLGAAISFMAVVAAITFTVTMIFSMNIFNDKVYNVKEREELYKKVSEIDHLIRQNYIGELDEQSLLNELSSGLMKGSNDPYAAYYDAETFSRLQAIENGRLVGIGAEMSRDESGYIRLNTVYDNSPAAAAELKDGDLIVAVNEQDIRTAGYTESLEQLMGEPGTRVQITYRRDSVDSSCQILYKVFEMPVVSLEMREDGNAYVKISAFSAAAVKQFRSVLNEITQSEATGIIFDLRNTAGGDLMSACEMLDLLLPAGDLLSATYKDGTTELLKRSDSNETNLPMVTLVNGKTQYAAELFAANVSDYGKSKLVGANTFGQGVMQQSYQLKDGSGIVLSSAYFNPAVSANFNEVGIKPDYEVTLSADAEKSLSHGTLAQADDTQLAKAVEVLDTSK